MSQQWDVKDVRTGCDVHLALRKISWPPVLQFTLPNMDLHTELFVIGAVVVTGWKLIGWTGALCFALRWGVQVWHRKRTNDTRLPPSFWWISVVGAAMTLAYFTFAQPDSVGILQNLLPLLLAGWNLGMDQRHQRAA